MWKIFININSNQIVYQNVFIIIRWGVTVIYMAIILVICFILLYLKSPSVKGQISEEFLAHKLDIKKETQYGGKILRNIYVPTPNGNTTEIDVLYITRKGIFVFENKNYAGYIFGNEKNKNWTVTLYAGRKVS